MSTTPEFDTPGNARLICLRYEAVQKIKRVANRMLKRTRPIPTWVVKHRYTSRQAKNIVLAEGLALTSGQPSWFYTAFDRGEADPLTNFAMLYIEQHVPKSASILVTGCGTGITVFHLADSGFQNVEGRDLLEKCIRVANRIKEEFRYQGTSFAIDDGFHPKLDKAYDAITALHWVFSAWMGNYGNRPADGAKDPAVREQLLNDFLSSYAPHLNPGGLLIVELTDAVADYREPHDHPAGLDLRDIYPVRHTPEQVQRCAAKAGLEIVEKRLCVSYGHQPRTTYILRKTGS